MDVRPLDRGRRLPLLGVEAVRSVQDRNTAVPELRRPRRADDEARQRQARAPLRARGPGPDCRIAFEPDFFARLHAEFLRVDLHFRASGGPGRMPEFADPESAAAAMADASLGSATDRCSGVNPAESFFAAATMSSTAVRRSRATSTA